VGERASVREIYPKEEVILTKGKVFDWDQHTIITLIISFAALSKFYMRIPVIEQLSQAIADIVSELDILHIRYLH